MAKWYFDPTSGEVSEGKVAAWTRRMGPYTTREEARNALKIAEARNEAADAAEEAEDDWGDD